MNESEPGTPSEAASTGPKPGTPVTRALAELDGLDHLDLADHPDAYQRIHAELQAALASIDES